MKLEDECKKVVLTLSYDEAERAWIALGRKLDLGDECVHYLPTNKKCDKTLLTLWDKLDEYVNT